MDGNSLGPLPLSVTQRLEQTVRSEWGELLIRGWNDAGWFDQPTLIGNRIGKLIGAPIGTVTLGDTLSIKIFQAVAAAIARVPERRVVLSDTGNFPTDLYMTQSLLRSLGQGHTLQLVEPEAVAAHLHEGVAALLLTHVDYRTGRMHDMRALTTQAHAHGIPVIWDLAHSAGAVPVDLAACGVEFAAGCTYKYLNAGPGAPAFVYLAEAVQEPVDPILSGWLGHAEPFAFDVNYRAGKGIERMRVGTPSVLAMAALDAALDIWDSVSMQDIRAESIRLSELFIQEVEARCPAMTLASPRNPDQRGSQVSFHHPNGYAAMQNLINQHQVIGDFRAPDIMRFAITPLYLDETDIHRAVTAIAEMGSDHDNSLNRIQNKVT